jgi:hypothetical protein
MMTQQLGYRLSLVPVVKYQIKINQLGSEDNFSEALLGS